MTKQPPRHPSKWEFRPGYQPTGWECKGKSKQSGYRCTKPAMCGKDVCGMHGGKSRIKHGLYSKYAVDRTMAERIEALEADPKLTDLRRQVAILSALQIEKLSAVVFGKVALCDDCKARVEAVPMSDEDLETTRKLTESVTKAIERFERTQNLPENMAPVGAFKHFAEVFSEAVNRHVDDSDARKKILDAINRGLDLRTPPQLH